MKKHKMISKVFVVCCLIVTVCCIYIFNKESADCATTLCFEQADNALTSLTQTVEANKTYYWKAAGNDYPADTIYLAGNLPILIVVPHGGSKTPSDIDSRGCGNTSNDAKTMELACELKDKIVSKTGQIPHMIINNLSRSKIDQNRENEEDCNPTSGRGDYAWHNFHEYLKKVATKKIMDDHGRGFYIEIHGKSGIYDFGANVFAGYNITSNELTVDEALLNDPAEGYIDKSSLRFLYEYLSGFSIPDFSFTSILRGDLTDHKSFGTLFYELLDSSGLDFTVVPRSTLKKPSPYLSGEYNLKLFCGVNDDVDYNDTDPEYQYDGDRFISGIQLETSSYIRTYSSTIRKQYAGVLADAIISYVNSNFTFPN